MEKHFLLIVAAFIIAACGSNPKDAAGTITLSEVFEQADVAGFYLRGKMRCPGCIAI